MKSNLVLAALFGLVTLSDARVPKEQNQLFLQEDEMDMDDDEDMLVQEEEDEENQGEEEEQDEAEEDSEEQSADEDAQDDDEEDAPEDENNLMLDAELQGDYFTPEMSGHAGLGENPYERVVPARFADGGDSFMASMIANYALESKNEDGTPTGKFFMDEKRTNAAANEVLKSHKKIDGKELEEYMKTYFARTWKHFDINNDGVVGVDVMPQFMRFLASDQALELN